MFLKSSYTSVVLPVESISSVFFLVSMFALEKKNLRFLLRIFEGFDYILN